MDRLLPPRRGPRLLRINRRSGPWIKPLHRSPRSASISARKVFHLVGYGTDGRIAFRCKIERLALIDTFKSLPPCIVGMEACLSAHFVSPSPLQSRHCTQLPEGPSLRSSVRRWRLDVISNLAGKRDREIGPIKGALSQLTAAPGSDSGMEEGHPDIRAKLLQERLASILAPAAALPTVNNYPLLRVLPQVLLSCTDAAHLSPARAPWFRLRRLNRRRGHVKDDVLGAAAGAAKLVGKLIEPDKRAKHSDY